MSRGIALSVAIAVAFVATTARAHVITSSAPACGAATQARAGAVYQNTALGIYRGELDSPAVRLDAMRVRASAALARSLAAGDTAGVTAATAQIVYHRHWHIVRLRVLGSSGALIADIGGPFILAPVRGAISYRGKTVGSYVMSVQDDIGFAKLFWRFTGLPIELYGPSGPLAGQAFPAGAVPSKRPAAGSALSIKGARYVARVFAVNAFPTGRSEVLLAVPRVSAALASSSCLTVDATVGTAVAEHLARRLSLPSQAAVFVAIDHAFDSSRLLFVRAGSRVVAGTLGVRAPYPLPGSGTIVYLGKRWLINSFVPVQGTRIYVLYPDTALGASIGPSGTTGAS